jgi:GT2 family glycosyltransferase
MKMKQDNPLVTVIILNWNGREFLDDCLCSLQAQSFKNFETVFVDNGSTDNSVYYVKEHFGSQVRLLELPENRGFAGGNNEGIAIAKGEYIALLNNDTEVDIHWLENLVECIEQDENVGMVGSKVLNFYRRREIDNTGHLMYPDGLNRGRGRLEEDHGQYDNKRDILFPSGCAALYRKIMLDEMGGFDEAFFAYGDDADIGLHGRFLGYGALYCPRAVVYHKYSATAGSYSPMKAFYVERNRVWILLKYFPIRNIILSPFYTLKRLSFQGYGILAEKGAANKFVRNSSTGKLIRIIIKAYISALKGIPDIWEKRKKILHGKAISNREMTRLLKAFRISCKDIALSD